MARDRWLVLNGARVGIYAGRKFCGLCPYSNGRCTLLDQSRVAKVVGQWVRTYRLEGCLHAEVRSKPAQITPIRSELPNVTVVRSPWPDATADDAARLRLRVTWLERELDRLWRLYKLPECVKRWGRDYSREPVCQELRKNASPGGPHETAADVLQWAAGLGEGEE